MKMTRREFLRSTGLGAGLLAMSVLPPFLLKRQAFAAGSASERKLLFIFQRGGNDGMNTCIPRGDADYNAETRPTLFIPEDLALDSGNGFAQFHPQLQPLMEIYNHSAINGRPGPGNLAVIHRVGYDDQSQSHFDSQQYWENGAPGNGDLHEGLFFRHLNETIDWDDARNAFVAASLSSSQLVALKGSKPIPNFRETSDFSFLGSPAQSAKFLGALPSSVEGSDGEGLLGLYGGPKDHAGKIYRSLVHQTGQLLGATMETLQKVQNQGPYLPENGAVYPDGSFGRKLQEAAMLFKRSPVRILGMNIGGWDTHSSQGQINGHHGYLLQEMGQGIQAFYRDLQSQWENLLVMTMTEFGRTSRENGSQGTDHAESSVMFVAGGGVKGGVYNCDASNWKTGDMFSESERYLARKTDFRSVFGEIFTNHFGDDPSLLDKIMPRYSEAAQRHPSDFQPLNFLT